ncbi:MAG: cobalamin B12-binding domain-containing protein [Planctomycetota bacterium]|nr:cobalamin B12-binding domain-containing protein [Planctomycetota bacterium]
MTEQNEKQKIRVIVAKIGFDGHDRGARVIARGLQEDGMEVIYAGLRQTPEAIVRAAIQEDVDAIGISSLNAAHMTIFPDILRLLKENEASEILLTGGGVIPEEDIDALEKLGTGKLFTPGADLRQICQYIRAEIRDRRSANDA